MASSSTFISIEGVKIIPSSKEDTILLFLDEKLSGSSYKEASDLFLNIEKSLNKDINLSTTDSTNFLLKSHTIDFKNSGITLDWLKINTPKLSNQHRLLTKLIKEASVLLSMGFTIPNLKSRAMNKYLDEFEELRS